MLDNLSVRNKFLAAAAVPALAFVAIAAWAATAAGEIAIAAVAAVGALATVAVAFAIGTAVAARFEPVLARVGALGATADASPPDSGPDVDAAQDEIGEIDRLAASVSERTAAVVAEQRARVSKNLSGLVANLSERNRALLDLQIDHIDWMEATEEDPDRLEALFTLDHLATRMRRTCESMMVLAGADDINQRDEPASVADVIRVAMGENEDYERISIRSIDGARIGPAAACDLAHLLSELLSNATEARHDDRAENSPEDDTDGTVEIHATHLSDGDYRITIIDRGVGMDAERMAAANSLIANPPDINLSVDDSIGLLVVGRLARQLGATVDLVASAGSGVTAEVLVPASVVSPASDADDLTLHGAAPRRRSTDHGSDATGVNATVGEQRGEPDWTPPTASRSTSELGVRRRERHAPSSPRAANPMQRAKSREPAEVASLITQYRDGLKDGRRD